MSAPPDPPINPKETGTDQGNPDNLRDEEVKKEDTDTGVESNKNKTNNSDKSETTEGEQVDKKDNRDQGKKTEVDDEKKSKKTDRETDAPEREQPAKKKKKTEGAEEEKSTSKQEDQNTQNNGEDTEMGGAPPPLDEDEDSDAGGTRSRTSQSRSSSVNSSSSGLSSLSDIFEDISKKFPEDDDPQFRKLEQQRRNYSHVNAVDYGSLPVERHFHEIRGHCTTLGILKMYGNVNTLYLNEYSGSESREPCNRVWHRLESQAEDEDYEERAEADEEFQRVNSIQLEERHASTQKNKYSLKYRFNKRDVFSLSSAAWKTNWDLIPWEQFEWKKIGLRSFEEAKARQAANQLSRKQLVLILSFQIQHEINQIDDELDDEYQAPMIYVRTLWKSKQYPVSWETQSNTKRVYGKNQLSKILKRSDMNGDRYLEGVLDPSIIEFRESSVGMDANGNRFNTTPSSSKRATIGNGRAGKKLGSWHSSTNEGFHGSGRDNRAWAYQSDDGSGDESKTTMKQILEQLKQLQLQVGANALQTNQNTTRLTKLDNITGKRKTPTRRRVRH